MSDPAPDTTTPETDHAPRRRRSRLLTGLLLLIIAGLAGATLAGRLGRYWWLLDLASHYVLYLAVASAGVMLLALVVRRFRVAVVALLMLAVNGWLLSPLYVGAPHGHTAGAANLNLAMMNILHKNRDQQRALDFIQGCDTDLIIIQELDTWWERTIREADTPYRFIESRPSEGSFGIALLAHESVDGQGRVVIEDTRVMDLADDVDGAERPAVEATLLIDGRRVKLLSIHPPPPVHARYTALRDDILRKAKAWADEQTDPHLIIGDLNTTPWSYAYDILIGDGELVSSLDGRGHQGTWPMDLPVPWLLPIDHCLYSADLVCTERRTGEPTGSDHLPLLVSLSIKP